MFKRSICTILACLMLCSAFPFTALAEELQNTEVIETTEFASIQEVDTATAETEPDVIYEEIKTTPIEETIAIDAKETVAQEITVQSPVMGSVSARGTCGPNATWTLDDNGTLTISGNGIMYDYSKDGSPWYQYRARIQCIVVEDGITNIGNYSFSGIEGCEIFLGEGITVIEAKDLTYCLPQTLHIPTSLERIENNVFSSSSAKPKYVHIKDLAAWCRITFESSNSSPLWCGYMYLNGELLTDLVIPDGITKINQFAFMGNFSIESLTIPATVTSIGQSAFYYCYKMETVRFLDIPQQFDSNAFTKCERLKEVHIQDIAAWCEASFSNANANPIYNDTATLYMDGQEVTELTIPQGVTKITAHALRNCKSLSKITIPDSLTKVGENAFSELSNLQAINITDLGTWCRITFANLESNPLYVTGTKKVSLLLNNEPITTLAIPDGVTEIGDYAFYNYTGFSHIAIADSVQRIGHSAFYGTTAPVTINQTSQLVELGDNVFENNTGIKEIYLPATLQAIGVNVFSGCTTMQRVVLGDKLTVIGESMFSGCTALENITIPGSIQTCGSKAFSGCSGLKNVIFEDGLSVLGEAMFANCKNLLSVSLPGSIRTVGDSVFSNCANLESVSIADGFPAISTSMFQSCSKLESLTIPASVKSVGNNAFYFSGLARIVFTGSAPVFSSKAFNYVHVIAIYPGDNEDWLNTIQSKYGGHPYWYCATEGVSGTIGNISWKLKDNVLEISGEGNMTYSSTLPPWQGYRSIIHKVIITGNVESLGQEAFSYCRALTEITLNEGLKTIGMRAFEYCENLKKIQLPETVTEIQTYAFYQCDALESINLPNSISHIGSSAFLGCDAIKAIDLPDSLTTIQEWVFSSCRSLETVKFHEGIKEIRNHAFQACVSLCDIQLPSKLKYIGAMAFYQCSSLKSIVIPKSFIPTNGSVFGECTSLIAIYFEENMPEFDDSYFFSGWYGFVMYPEGNKTWTKSKIAALEASYENGNVICIANNGTNNPQLRAESEPLTGLPLLLWCPLDGIDSYEIWRSTSKNGSYTKIEVIDTFFWYDTTASGKTYYYKVRGLNSTDPSKNTGYSTVRSAAGLLGIPLLYGEYNDGGKIELSWTEVEGAKKYEVYRATSENGKYTKLTTTTKCSYTDTSAAPGKLYYYKVRAVASNSAYNSQYSNYLYGYAILARPKVKVSIDSNSGKPKLSWDKISSATEYTVYRWEDDPDFADTLTTQKGTTYLDTEAETDVSYTYVVIALGKNNLSSELSNQVVASPSYARPSTPKSTYNELGEIVLSWNSVDGAVSYNIYRSTKSGSSYKLVGSSEGLNFTDETASGSTTYYYKVSTVGKNSESGQSNYVKATGRCAIPELTVQAGSTGKPVLTWNKISGAKKYEIHRSIDGGAFKKLTTVTGTSYTDSKATEGVECTYKVKALGSNSSYNGNFSEVKGCKVVCAAPSLTAKVDTATGKPGLSWSKVTGATGYAIYRNGELLTTITGTSHVDTTAATDGQYSYYVVTVGKTEDFNSVASATKTVTAVVGQPKVTGTINNNGKPVITWDAVEDAVTYKVYRSTSSSKSYKEIATVTDLTYVDTSVSAGKTYYYKVMAVGENSKSAQSAYVKLTGKCDIPTLNVEAGTTGKPVLSWNKISGAKKYEIWRSVDGAAFKKLTTVTKTTYTDTKATEGAQCTYKVKALGSKSSYNGLFSEELSCYVTCAVPTVTVKVDAATGKPSLSWKKITGATGYEIYRTMNGSNQVMRIIVQELSFVDETAEIGAVYTYTVKALGKAEVYNSAPSKAATVTTTCGQTKATGKIGETGKPELTWTEVEGATTYVVYRSTSSSKNFKKIGESATTSYTDTSAKKGTTYYYRVVAVTDGVTGAQSSSTGKLKAKK